MQREAIQRLIPHQGAMCLWDAVLDWDDSTIRLRAANHRDPSHPLRGSRGLRALHLCEYGAQAMAVHGGLLAQRAGQRAEPGLLVALRAVRVHVARIDKLADELIGEAESLVHGPTGWQYAFRIHHAGALLAEGRAAVMPQATHTESLQR